MLKFRDDPRRFAAGLVSLLIAAQITVALILKPPTGREVQLLVGLAALAFFWLAKSLLKIHLFRRQEEHDALSGSSHGFRDQPWTPATQRASPALPITLTSRPPIRLLLATILLVSPCAIATIAAIPMLPDRTGFILLVLAGGNTVLFSWMTCRAIWIRSHPNTLIINRDGLSVSINGKNDFVAWDEIASAYRVWTGGGWPYAAAVRLTQAAAQRRKAGNRSLSHGRDFINLSNLWQMDEGMSTEDLVATLETCRRHFAANPIPA